jgi:hypothetical protein
MKSTVNKRMNHVRQADAIVAKINQANQYIDRAGFAAVGQAHIGIDYAYIDATLAKAISVLASARAIAIIEGNLGDPAFDDGDLWDWDDEIGIPDLGAAAEGKGVR